jgi:hypothetical protein
MTLDDIAITVDEHRQVTLSAPVAYRALAALVEDDMGSEGELLYTVLARLYTRDENGWKITGDSCTVSVQGDQAVIVNNFNDDRTELTRQDLRDVLERTRDEMAFARARRGSGEA